MDFLFPRESPLRSLISFLLHAFLPVSIHSTISCRNIYWLHVSENNPRPMLLPFVGCALVSLDLHEIFKQVQDTLFHFSKAVYLDGFPLKIQWNHQSLFLLIIKFIDFLTQKIRVDQVNSYMWQSVPASQISVPRSLILHAYVAISYFISSFYFVQVVALYQTFIKKF